MKKRLIAIAAVLLVAAITGVTWAQVTGTTSIGVSTAGVAGDFANVKTAYDAGFSNLKYTHNPSWSPIENASGNITHGDVYYIDVTAYTGDLLVTLYLTNVPELGADYSYMLQQINVYAKTASKNVVVSDSAEVVQEGGVGGATITANSTKPLGNKPVEAGSETIKNGTTTLVRGTDYTIAYNTGVITFLKAVTIAASTSVTADYTYYTYGSWTQAKLADGTTTIGTVYLSLQNGFVSFILAGNAYYDITIDGGLFYCIDTTDNPTHDLAPSYYLDVRQA